MRQSALHTASALAAGFAARFPNAAVPGTLDTLAASAEDDGKINLGFCKYDPTVGGTVDLAASAASVDLQAAGVHGFASVAGKLQWVRAVQNFHLYFELIPEGDFVEVPDNDAKRLVAAGRAVLSTAEEAAASQKKK